MLQVYYISLRKYSIPHHHQEQHGDITVKSHLSFHRNILNNDVVVIHASRLRIGGATQPQCIRVNIRLNCIVYNWKWDGRHLACKWGGRTQRMQFLLELVQRAAVLGMEELGERAAWRDEREIASCWWSETKAIRRREMVGKMQDAAGRQQCSSPWLDGVVASWSCVKLRPATDDSPTDGLTRLSTSICRRWSSVF